VGSLLINEEETGKQRHSLITSLLSYYLITLLLPHYSLITSTALSYYLNDTLLLPHYSLIIVINHDYHDRTNLYSSLYSIPIQLYTR
jgi:hypothetical protein